MTYGLFPARRWSEPFWTSIAHTSHCLLLCAKLYARMSLAFGNKRLCLTSRPPCPSLLSPISSRIIHTALKPSSSRRLRTCSVLFIESLCPVLRRFRDYLRFGPFNLFWIQIGWHDLEPVLRPLSNLKKLGVGCSFHTYSVKWLNKVRSITFIAMK